MVVLGDPKLGTLLRELVLLTRAAVCCKGIGDPQHFARAAAVGEGFTRKDFTCEGCISLVS